ncbi:MULTISPECIES: hypothetical protein [unclassified Rhodanobacter]|uniref:hypothetical protein n=1 Tax=unclassified Rhodanobacter TaxID=2621553 RepID=UPI00203246E9|nr:MULTISPECIES: hypothetical protein [unclassified Rhodanobacter]
MSPRFALPSLLLGMFASVAIAATSPDAALTSARTWFGEATRQCQADHGRLWGKTLCGPMLLVVPATRQVIASQADAQGKLHAEGGVFVGRLPEDQTLANTSLDWAGVHWSEMLWPLPGDALERRTLMAHESFHRIQQSLGLPAKDGDNAHMDTLDGRYTMQLEWRALDAALAATTDASRRARIADALAFRAARYRRFPTAERSEAALERNEGLAEYTGMMVGNRAPADRLAVARKDLAIHAGDAGLTRSFAYATGPAYGLLLDRYRPDWRREIVHGGSPAAWLAAALHIDMTAGSEVEPRAARYDGAALMASERARAAAHAKRVAAYTSQLVAGPVLQLPLKHMKVQFNPSNLLPLGDAGTVYPTMHVSDDWGTIDVDGGALLTSDWSRLSVAVPPGGVHDGKLHGKGWTLQLAPDWQPVPGARAGDWTVRQAIGK